MLMNMLQPQFNFCRACQAENRLTAKFCRQCGDMLIKPAAKKVVEQLPDLFYAALAEPAKEDNNVAGMDVAADPKPETANDLLLHLPVIETKGFPVNCPGCNVLVRQADLFCLWCGHKQADKPKVLTKACAGCKIQLPMPANFCFHCGLDATCGNLQTVRPPTHMFAEEESDLFPRFEV
jgi:ribosomal protein L40E